MDFMAGAMAGVTASILFGFLLLADTHAAISARLKNLEEMCSAKIKRDNWDEADFWKRGYENDDEV